ncbi:MAG: hypothetical protein ACI81T_002665, partial [Bacteroidia bacterium]
NLLDSNRLPILSEKQEPILKMLELSEILLSDSGIGNVVRKLKLLWFLMKK